MDFKNPDFNTFFWKRTLGFMLVCLAFDLLIGKRNIFLDGWSAAAIGLGMYLAGGILYALVAWRFRERK